MKGKTLLINIGRLYGCYDSAPGVLKGEAMNHVPSIEEAFVAIEDERIASFGPMSELPDKDSFRQIIDVCHGDVFPCFCDSHTHLVYAGSRDGEFRDKIAGLSYEEIARRGGGILNSADLLAETSEDELFKSAEKRLRQCAAGGTGAIEIKSGYGLTTESELKMLRVIRRLREAYPQLEIRATFLGAHAVGRAYKGRQSEYVDLIINEMLPAVAKEGLADFVDVFCDEGFFTVGETDRILKVAAALNIPPKIHANELAVSGGVEVGVANNALSVDHLERIAAPQIEVLKSSSTIPTMLPGASFFLGMPYGIARQVIAAGLPLALASDYNPGSSPSGSMRFVSSLGCFRMKLTPEESLNAVTVNGAAAMGMKDIGAIFPGAFASMFITEPLPSLAYLQYAYTEPVIKRVILKGRSL